MGTGALYWVAAQHNFTSVFDNHCVPGTTPDVVLHAFFFFFKNEYLFLLKLNTHILKAKQCYSQQPKHGSNLNAQRHVSGQRRRGACAQRRIRHKKDRDNALCIYLDAARDYHTKWSKSERERQILSDVESQVVWMNLSRKQTYRQCGQIYGCQRGGEGGKGWTGSLGFTVVNYYL